MPTIIGPLKSHPCMKRHPANPVLTAREVPYPATLIFNPGVTKYEGRYVMAFRNDYGSEQEKRLDGTNIGLAWSDDGVKWRVEPQPCFAMKDDEIQRVYDPRLIVIEGRCHMCFAVDTRHGCCGGIALTDDFRNFEVLSITTPDNRNLVLFPERIGGKYVRLERPFPVYSRGAGEHFDIWISDSPDLRYWGNSKLLLGAELVPFANAKIGPAAPPVRTPKGWLATFHAVDIDPSRGKNGWEASWKKRYTTGIMLLDLDDPRKVVGICADPILAPEAPYEVEGGFRNNAIFPCGMILEDSGETKLYYGAADTVVCLATADVGDLLKLCGC
ncbi:MAG TPA: glycoside hydrolase family 130 protein [Candidatus Brocadiia bacterium]|nr:glycoside hydrolase family 130 protein [Candidatus Brocadiia bacterium]